MNRRIFLLSFLFIACAAVLGAQNMSFGRASDRLLRFEQKAQTMRRGPLRSNRVIDYDKDASIADAETFGTLAAEDGTTWFYTMSFEESTEFYYCYGSVDVDVYDSSNAKVSSLHYDVPAGMKVNSIQPFGAISSKFYNTDSKSQELTLYVHEVTPDYTSRGHIVVFNLTGEIVKEYEADNLLWIDASENWNTYQRAIIVTYSTDDEGHKTTVMSVMKPASWTSAEPEVEHVFEVRDDLLDYSNGPCLNTYVIEGELYYVLSNYEMPYVIGYDENYEMIFQENNNYQVQVYDKNYQLVSQLSIPVTHPDYAYCSTYAVGLYSSKDLTKGYFTGDDKLNLVVTRNDVRLDTDDDTYTYAFIVYDMEGNQVAVIAENVISWKQLQSIPSCPDQVGCICLNDEIQTLRMINLPSCETQVEFAAMLDDDRRISDAYDRYSAAGGYQYVIGMGNATSNTNNDVIASIGWFTDEGELDRYVNFNLGQQGEYFTPLVEGYALNPALFNTDDYHEYLYIAKLSRNDGSKKIDNVLVLADENGEIIERYQGDDTQVLRIASLIDTETTKPRLVVGYSNEENGTYSVDFYNLPFVKFEDGGDGSVENPYLVSSAGDMRQIASEPEAHYLLEQDIDMSVIAEPWSPIDSFYGSIDGAGYSVNNLYIESNASYSGLFGYLNEKSSVKNLTFRNAKMHITRSNRYAGLVAGMTIKSTIDSIFVNGYEITADADATAEVGGLVGQATYYTKLYANGITAADFQLAGCARVGGMASSTFTGTTIDACLFEGTVVATSELGGMVGVSGTDCTIKNCHVNADLVAENTLGGLVGDASRGVISNNVVEGTLEATGADMFSFACVGGVAGLLESDWGKKSTKIVVGNVVALSSIEASADAAHRVIGYTIADEEYADDETPEIEQGLDKNYVSAAMVMPSAISDDAKSESSVEGADYDVLSRQWLESIGFAFGTTVEAPWTGDDAPALYFEDSISGIYTISADKLTPASDAIYNLNGQRVEQLHKGIYMVGGKKILIN